MRVEKERIGVCRRKGGRKGKGTYVRLSGEVNDDDEEERCSVL